MPTATTSIAAHVAGTVFLLLSHTAVVLQIKSSRILDAKISVRAAAVVLAGVLVSHTQFFRSGRTFEGCVSSLSRAFGLGEHTSFTSPVEEGKTVVTYLARFAHAVSENDELFNFATMVAMVSCCFYVLHSALIKTIGNSAVSEGSSSASSSSAPSAAAPGTAMDGFVKVSWALSKENEHHLIWRFHVISRNATVQSKPTNALCALTPSPSARLSTPCSFILRCCFQRPDSAR